MAGIQSTTAANAAAAQQTETRAVATPSPSPSHSASPMAAANSTPLPTLGLGVVAMAAAQGRNSGSSSGSAQSSPAHRRGGRYTPSNNSLSGKGQEGASGRISVSFELEQEDKAPSDKDIIARLRAELAEMKQGKAKYKALFQRAANDLAHAKSDITRQENEIADLRSELETAVSKIKELKRENRTIRAKLDAARLDVAEAREELRSAPTTPAHGAASASAAPPALLLGDLPDSDEKNQDLRATTQGSPRSLTGYAASLAGNGAGIPTLRLDRSPERFVQSTPASPHR